MSNYKPLTEENCNDFKNFKYSEFKCKCGAKYCNGYPVAFSYELAKNLQNIREHFKKALIITSALRCTQHNKNVGGVTNSKHLKGFAVDFYISGVSYDELAKYVKTLSYFNYCYKVKKNQNVIHYDIKPPAYTEEPKNDNNSEVDDLKSKISDLESKISEYDKEILNLKNENAELLQNNTNFEQKIKELENSTVKYKKVCKVPRTKKYRLMLYKDETIYTDKK